ncbi:retrovirus-related pol polyprotein from transposon TNT 1-94 [Tanacetum coccineum]
MKETSYELLKDTEKKQLGKNEEAKMTIYNVLSRKEYERVFMCKTAKEVWHTLIITHQGNSQVKNCKIDLLTQEYEKFHSIMKKLSIVVSLYSMLLAKVTAIEEAKDLATIPLDKLIGNLKVYEMVLDNDGVASKVTKEKVNSLALKAKVTRKQTSDNSTCQDKSDEDEEINLMAKNFRKFSRKGVKVHDKFDIYQVKEPNNIKEAIKDESWTKAMQEELDQFVRNDVWDLVPCPQSRLVAQGYNQQGIDYDETYAPVARLESIRILLAYACCYMFKLFQMDVRSDFLNRVIDEEVYVMQPSSFIDFQKPNHVYKLKKALYGLKQAPKAWYDRLQSFLIDNGYKMGIVDNTLFTKIKDSLLIIIQIYVDDIIFGSTCQSLCDEFSKLMHDEFEICMMGELSFFLGLQIKQMNDGIFFNQSKYIREMLKKFGMENSKATKTPMSRRRVLTLNKDSELIDITKYRGMIDHAIDVVDRESTSDICTFIGSCLTSWFSKKQTSLANSITQSDYVTVGRACQQALWMKQASLDYKITLNEGKIKEPLSPRLNEDAYSICCENTTHMMNALKEARIESREMLLSIYHSLKMLLDIISKMNRKLEDEKIKRNDKGKEKVNEF